MIRTAAARVEQVMHLRQMQSVQKAVQLYILCEKQRKV